MATAAVEVENLEMVVTVARDAAVAEEVAAAVVEESVTSVAKKGTLRGIAKVDFVAILL